MYVMCSLPPIPPDTYSFTVMHENCILLGILKLGLPTLFVVNNYDNEELRYFCFRV